MFLPPILSRYVPIYVCLAIPLLFASTLLQAAPPEAPRCAAPIAKIVSVEGLVELQPCAAGLWCHAQPQQPLCEGDRVRTGSNSRSALLLQSDQTLIRLDQQTTLQLVAVAPSEQSTMIRIKQGIINLFSRVQHQLEIHTPYVAAVLRGTELAVSVANETTTIDLFEGKVVAKNEWGELLLNSGERAQASAGVSPRLVQRIDPLELVQWSLHYQPLLHALPLPVAQREQLTEWIHQGRLDLAIAHLDALPSPQPAEQLYRAALLLASGQVNAAERALTVAEVEGAAQADALSLRAIIALGRNANTEALGLAKQAVALNAKSSAAWLALSFAAQAQGDLDAAQSAVAEALRQGPENAFVQARAAELWLARRDLERALTAAKRAEQLDPQVALTHSVLGFAHLVRREGDAARAAFALASRLDPSDPMAHLGQGLALIHQGELNDGREELEVATILDPRNALLRSYLGKAYFDERRDRLAELQYQLARELDPQDPTPWYYAALLAQWRNDPVTALEMLQASIARNDNRAVYRSPLRLEEDRAARDAALAGIYRDLGFNQLLLQEADKAVLAAPADYAGHRMLAESYTALPQHEVARVSEHLQAQLLQPANNRPLDPLMAETRITAPRGIGPADPSLNEYGALFARSGGRAWLSGVRSGEANGAELLLSAMHGSLAGSFARYQYTDNGLRPNADLKRDISAGYAQWDFTARSSVQLELRRSELTSGDLAAYFAADAYDASLRNSSVRNTERLGLRHAFNADAVTLVSLIHTQLNGEGSLHHLDLLNVGPPFGFVQLSTDWAIEQKDDALSGEIRHIQRLPGLTLNLGAGSYSIDRSVNNTSMVGFTPPIFPSSLTPLIYDSQVRHSSLYTYATLARGSLSLDLGLSYDQFRDKVALTARDEKRFNPKLGLIWEPDQHTRIRLAAFRTLLKPMANWQTLEPTQVAGFNQFFQDTEGDLIDHRGLALERQLNPRWFTGIELTQRERDSWSRNVQLNPATGSNTESLSEFTTREQNARLWLYGTPHRLLGLTIEYYQQRLKNFDRAPALTVDTRTQRLPVTLSWFGPYGLSGALQANYIKQNLITDTSTTPMLHGESSFWSHNASVSLTLPGHRGALSLHVNNLLDRAFQYQEQDTNQPLYMPERTLALRISLATD